MTNIKHLGSQEQSKLSQLNKFLIVKQILLVSTLGNVERPVQRVCILMLKCKGFKKLVVHWASIIRDSIALEQNPPVKFPLPKLIFIFRHVGYSSVILCYHKLLLLFIMKTVLT